MSVLTDNGVSVILRIASFTHYAEPLREATVNAVSPQGEAHCPRPADLLHPVIHLPAEDMSSNILP